MSGRVLVAAAPSDDRDAVCSWLEGDGLGVRAVEDADRTMSVLRTGRFDLLLLDAALPGPDGPDGVAVVDAVRRDPGTASLPVVVLGAAAVARSVLHCIETGADDVLWAPVAPASLRARVASGLARAWLAERERECRERVRHLAAALDGTAPGPGDIAGAEDPFGLLARILARTDEQVRECEHRLRRQAGGLRLGA